MNYQVGDMLARSNGSLCIITRITKPLKKKTSTYHVYWFVKKVESEGDEIDDIFAITYHYPHFEKPELERFFRKLS